jgi:hypothetical protein
MRGIDMRISIDKYQTYSLDNMSYTDLLIISLGLQLVIKNVSDERIINSAKWLLKDIPHVNTNDDSGIMKLRSD